MWGLSFNINIRSFLETSENIHICRFPVHSPAQTLVRHASLLPQLFNSTQVCIGHNSSCNCSCCPGKGSNRSPHPFHLQHVSEGPEHRKFCGFQNSSFPTWIPEVPRDIRPTGLRFFKTQVGFRCTWKSFMIIAKENSSSNECSNFCR